MEPVLTKDETGRRTCRHKWSLSFVKIAAIVPSGKFSGNWKLNSRCVAIRHAPSGPGNGDTNSPSPGNFNGRFRAAGHSLTFSGSSGRTLKADMSNSLPPFFQTRRCHVPAPFVKSTTETPLSCAQTAVIATNTARRLMILFIDILVTTASRRRMVAILRSMQRRRGRRRYLKTNQAMYVLAVVLPPWPVQFVWKNSPRGLSTRS